MASLTFYGGVDEIGGNKILLEDGAASVFLDFGLSYGRRGLYYEEYLKPRAVAGLRDLLEMGLLPPLKGIYREDLLQPEDWKRFETRPDYRGSEVNGVVLSHAHFDHSGYISFLKETTPVIASLVTAVITKSIQDSAQADFEKEVCYATPRELRDGVYQTVRKAPVQQRPFQVFASPGISPAAHCFWEDIPATKGLSGCPLHSGCNLPLNIRHFPVDHSIFGASAFALETSSGWVCYTGDLRVHGSGAALTQAFVEEAAKLHPRVLVCEGTRIGDARRITEEEVYANALKAVRESEGLVLADFGPRNIERLLIFHQIAAETSRRLVVMCKDAYLLDKLSLVMPEVPSVEKMAALAVYREPKATVLNWESDLRARFASRLVGPQEIRGNQKDFILCFSFWDVNDLVDLLPEKGCYIYSSSEVYDEEGALDMTRLHNWADHFHLTKVGLPAPAILSNGAVKWEVPVAQQGLHASGHASGPELIEIIKSIGPEILVPVHTEAKGKFAEALKGTGIEVRFAGYGKAMEF